MPLTLARLPADAAFGVVEIGMNHAGEITPLVAMVRPHVALVTTIAPVHIEHLGSIEEIADAKAEIFSGLEPGGAAILNRDAPQFDRLEQAARARGARTLSFGADAQCDARLIGVVEEGGGSRVRALALGRELDFALGAPGVHMAENALGVLLAADALGADLARAAAALAEFAPQKGRGERFTLQSPSGPFTVIDESYNANPASMRAALALLGAARPGAARAPHRRHRRHAGARPARRRDARGAGRGARREPRRSPVRRGAVDARAFRRRARADARGLGRAITRHFGRIGERAARRRRRDGQGFERQPHGAGGGGASRTFFIRRDARSRKRTMLTWLADFSHVAGLFNLFRYLTFRTLGAATTGLLLVFFFGPMIISALRLKQGKGQPIRADGPASHLLTKKGTPTMGGLMILFGLVRLVASVGEPGEPVCLDRAVRHRRLRRRSASTTTISR